MAQGYKDFTAGAVLTAADLEDYNQNQSVMRFANAAARDAALTTVKTEGMMAYLIDVNTVTVYNGSAWSTVGPVHGALLTWTPVVVQSATPTLTVQNASYVRIGRMIVGNFQIALTSSGTAGNAITLTLPVTAAANQTAIGSGYLVDTSTGFFYSAVLVPADTTKTWFLDTAINAGASTAVTMGSGASTFNAALATGDSLVGSFHYMAAADA